MTGPRAVPNGSRYVPARWVIAIMVAILAPVGFAVVNGATHERAEGHPVIVERVKSGGERMDRFQMDIDAFRVEQGAQTKTLNEIAATVRVIDERTKGNR